MDAQPLANALPLIEARFAFLIADYGFELVQSTEVPSSAWFRREGRTIVVGYDIIHEAAVDVDFEDTSTGTRYRLHDILAFESTIRAERATDLRDRERIVAEIDRCAELVARHAHEFLAGDLVAFRFRFREALLVQTTRASAMREFYEGDVRRARALFEAFRSYWNEIDREHFAQLEAGTSLRFRRGT